MLVQIRGMKRLEKSVLANNYQTLWCAGKSAELITSVLSCEKIISDIKEEYYQRLREISPGIEV
jgi:hypothetical protein